MRRWRSCGSARPTPIDRGVGRLAEPLRRSATRLVELGAITAELRTSEGGVIIQESAFVGGSGHQVYEHGCEPRRATWDLRPGTQIHTMTATFALDPAPPQAAW